jgi:hypothetical protein
MIDANGKIFNIKIVKGVSPDIDNEVIRVLSIMPNWSWSKKIPLGRRPNVKRFLPVTFLLK